jgi:RNA polymerase sigma factor (sigma-70 family)
MEPDQFNRLMAQYYGCDVSAFDQLEEELHVAIVKILLGWAAEGRHEVPGRLSRSQAAADVALDVIDKIYETKGRPKAAYDPGKTRHWGNWVRTLLERHLIDLSRLADGQMTAEPEDPPETADDSPWPIWYNELEAALAEEVARLPADEQSVLEMVYARGQKQKEVATACGLDEWTLSRLLTRLRQQLTSCLAARGYREGSMEDFEKSIKQLLKKGDWHGR